MWLPLLLLPLSWAPLAVAGGSCEPPTLEHGHVQGSGDDSKWSGVFSCSAGYSLVGARKAKCRGGRWSTSPPRCAGGHCDPALIPQVDHARVRSFKELHYRGTVYSYSCNRGYKLSGPGKVVCVGDRWDLGGGSVCARPGCDESYVSSIPFGQAERRAGGAVYTFKCEEGGEVVGSPLVWCDGARWNGSAPHCLRSVLAPSLTLEPPSSMYRPSTVVVAECRGQEVAPPSTVALELVAGGAATPLGLAASGHLRLELPPLEAAHHGAEVRCAATQGAMAADTANVTTVRLNVTYGPDRVVMVGGEEGAVGEEVEVHCSTSPSNPPATISWRVEQLGSGEEEEVEVEVEEGEVQEVWTGTGWEARQSATIPLVEGVREVVVRCTATNTYLGHSTSVKRVVRVHYPPSGVVVEGPTSVRAGEEVEVRCTSGDSFPPPLLSWKVRRGGEEEQVGGEETVVEEVEGRSTTSLLTFTAGEPGTLQVECYGSHSSLGTDQRAHTHTLHVLGGSLDSDPRPENMRANEADDDANATDAKSDTLAKEDEAHAVKSLAASGGHPLHPLSLLPWTLWAACWLQT